MTPIFENPKFTPFLARKTLLNACRLTKSGSTHVKLSAKLLSDTVELLSELETEIDVLRDALVSNSKKTTNS